MANFEELLYMIEKYNEYIELSENTGDVTIDIKTYTSDTDIRKSKKDVINIQSTFSQKERKLMGLDSNEKIKEKIIAKFIAKVDNVPVAYFSLQDVGHHINASVGTRNGDKFRGHGYATQCIKEGLKWYKNNKHKFKNKLIVWWAEKENIGSQKTAEKAGFKKDLSINKSNDEWLKNNWYKYIYR